MDHIQYFKANVKLLSKEGQTPLDVATAAKKEAAANYLEACTPTINLDDDFVTYPDHEFVKVEDKKTLDMFPQGQKATLQNPQGPDLYIYIYIYILYTICVYMYV